ncbi:hypothetical protein BPNPMPFG_005117 [Mesorhizobium sp. AR07]|nr:hypothetical protein BPNPMPFG_005117 [Mesorhizobium sp. AR07]
MARTAPGVIGQHVELGDEPAVEMPEIAPLLPRQQLARFAEPCLLEQGYGIAQLLTRKYPRVAVAEFQHELLQMLDAHVQPAEVFFECDAHQVLI